MSAHGKPRIMIREAIASDGPRNSWLMESVPGFWQSRWSDDVILKALWSDSGMASRTRRTALTIHSSDPPNP